MKDWPLYECPTGRTHFKQVDKKRTKNKTREKEEDVTNAPSERSDIPTQGSTQFGSIDLTQSEGSNFL